MSGNNSSTLGVPLANRWAFLKSYFHPKPSGLGEIFVPGAPRLTAGARVLLQLDFLAEAQRFNLRGTVSWVRLTGTARLPIGMGVEIDASERGARDLILDFARGRNVRLITQRAPRLPAHLEVRYAVDSLFLTDFTDDLSEGGAFIATEQAVAVGTPLQLKLKFPGRWLPLRLAAEVTRVVADGPRRGIGVRFLYTTQRARTKMQRLVDNLRGKQHN